MEPIDNSNEGKPTFITATGSILTLRPVSAVLIRSLQTYSQGMPQPPVIEVELGKERRKTKQANPDDPDYIKALAQWQEAKNERFLIYMFERGVENDPTPEDADRIREFALGASTTYVKYIWILEQLGSDDGVGELATAIAGQTVATPKGVAEAEATFRSEDKPDTDQ